VPVGDKHFADPFGWPLCGASGPLRGYNATSPPCRDCRALQQKANWTAPQVLAPSAHSGSRIKTFWCERAARARESLRRITYGASKDKPRTEKICRVDDNYQHGHIAEVVIGEIDFPLDNEINGDSTRPFDRADPRWPKKCAKCDYLFVDEDSWFHDIDRLYQRTDTGELIAHDKMPAGATYDAVWLRDFGYVGADGIAYTVVLPDGTHWHVDSRANNCPFPRDFKHYCWGRTGDPRACNVVAGKGPPGEAGAGSILSPGYHGFLGGSRGDCPGWLIGL